MSPCRCTEDVDKAKVNPTEIPQPTNTLIEAIESQNKTYSHLIQMI